MPVSPQGAIIDNQGTPTGGQVDLSTSQLTTPNVTSPSAISVDGLNQDATAITVPNQPSPTNPNTTNSSIPTPENIINESTTPTPAETQQKGIMGRISDLLKGKTSLATLQTNQETQSKVPDYTKTVNDLTTQLQGLNDQSTALSNEANYTIPNVIQENNTGLLSTRGGTAPQQASALRQNQIKQGAIASQSLTLKSVLYAAQGNLTLAKDAADKAAQVQFDAQEQDINYQKSLLDAITPQLNKEQAAQAEVMKTKLADRQTMIDNQKQDKSTMIGWAAVAAKNGATPLQVQAIANSPDLATALKNYTPFTNNPQEVQKAVLDLALTRSQVNKNNADAVKLANDVKTQQADNIDIPSVVASISNPNVTSSQLGGLTVNGLLQKAQTYMTNGGNIQGLGLSSTGNSGVQRTLIANYAGYLASKLGLTIPQITAAYKANAKAATDITGRIARIDTTSSTLAGQFPRLAQLATSVGNLGITESDLTAGKAAVARKFGSVDAGNYVELIQTIRGDYSAMQAAIGGSKGGTFFGQIAKDAIPLGLTADQYLGLAQTIKQSADIASQSSSDEIQKLIGGTSTSTSDITKGTQASMNGATYTYNGTGDTADINNWTKQ